MQESIQRMDNRLLELLECMEKRNNEGRNHSGGEGENLGSTWGTHLNEKIRRLEVPYFTGEYPYGWIYRAERYFQVNRIPEPEKVMAAAICLEGRALNWFQWWEPRTTWVTWNLFRNALLQRFQLSSTGNSYEALISLKQSGTVAEYRENFELMSAPLRHADEEVLKAAFMNGLRDEVKAEVRLHSMEDLGDIMTLAQPVEERNQLLGRVAPNPISSVHWAGSGPTHFNRPALTMKTQGTWEGNGPGHCGGVSPQTQGGLNGSRAAQMGSNGGVAQGGHAGASVSSAGSGSGSAGGGFRRGSRYKKLTHEEMQDKIRRKVCFRCDAPFSQDHVCQNQHLNVLVLSPMESEQGPEEEENDGEGEEGGQAM